MKRRIIITVHGIRTFAKWQRDLETLFREQSQSLDWEVSFAPFHYSFFTIFSFLLPFARKLKVHYFKKELLSKLSEQQWDRIDIVAHSFGTEIVARALLAIAPERRPKIHTVVLAGSVLESAFPWSELLGRSVLRVVNDCGVNDWILVLNQLCVLRTGMAGKVGFTGLLGEALYNRYFNFGHSGYFSQSQITDYWIPILVDDRVVQADSRRTNPISDLTYLVLNNLDTLKLAIWLTPTVLAVLWVYSLYINEAKAREEVTLALAESALVYDPSRSIDLIKEISYRPKSLGEHATASASMIAVLYIKAIKLVDMVLPRIAVPSFLEVVARPRGERGDMRMLAMEALSKGVARSYSAEPGKAWIVAGKGNRFLVAFASNGGMKYVGSDGIVREKKLAVTPSYVGYIDEDNQMLWLDQGGVWHIRDLKSEFDRSIGETGQLPGNKDPKGNDYLVAMAKSRDVVMWATRSGLSVTALDVNNQQQYDLTSEVGAIHKILLSPDENLLAVAGDKGIEVWDLLHKFKHEVLLLGNYIKDCSFDSSSSLIAVISNPTDRGAKRIEPKADEIRVWSYKTQKWQIISMKDCTSPERIIFSPTGRNLVASQDDNHGICLWQELTKNPTILRHEDNWVSSDAKYRGEQSITFSGDGKLVASPSRTTDKFVTVWNLTTGQSTTLRGHGSVVNQLQFTGKAIISVGFQGDIKIWNLDSVWYEQHTPPRQFFECRFFVPVNDIEREKKAGENNNNQFDVKIGLESDTICTLDRDATSISPNGRRVTFKSAGVVGSGLDSSFAVWDWQRPEAGIYRGHTASVVNVVLSPKDDLLASASADGTVRLWNTNSHEYIVLGGDSKADHEDGAWNLSFSKSGSLLATSDGRGNVMVWNISKLESNTSKPTASLFKKISLKSIVINSLIGAMRTDDKAQTCQIPFHMAFGSDKWIVLGCDNVAVVWDLERDSYKLLKNGSNPILAIASDQSDLVATADIDTIRIWNWKQSNSSSKILGYLRTPVLSLAFSKNGKSLAAGSLDGQIAMWDISSRHQRIVRCCGSRIRVLTFTDDKKLTAIDDSGSLYAWPDYLPYNVEDLRSELSQF